MLLDTIPIFGEKIERAKRAAGNTLLSPEKTAPEVFFDALKDVTEFECRYALDAHLISDPDAIKELMMWKARNDFIVLHGYAAISAEDIRWFAELTGWKPMVEAGAGAGYLANECKRLGLHVVPTDPNPPEQIKPVMHAWRQPVPPIICAGQEAVEAFPDHNLLYSWPAYDQTHTEEVIRDFTGEFVVYIGEGPGGCTGTDEFHDILDTQFTLEGCRKIRNFPSIHDQIHVYRRAA